MSDFKHFVLEDSLALIEKTVDYEGECFFYVSSDGFYNSDEGSARLYEAIEEYDNLGFPSTAGFSYQVLGTMSVFGVNDYLVVKANNKVTTSAFLLMASFQDEDVIGFSSDANLRIDMGFYEIQSSNGFIEKLKQICPESGFVFVFHCLHIDRNLIIGVTNCLDLFSGVSSGNSRGMGTGRV